MERLCSKNATEFCLLILKNKLFVTPSYLPSSLLRAPSLSFIPFPLPPSLLRFLSFFAAKLSTFSVVGPVSDETHTSNLRAPYPGGRLYKRGLPSARQRGVLLEVQRLVTEGSCCARSSRSRVLVRIRNASLHRRQASVVKCKRVGPGGPLADASGVCAPAVQSLRQ